MDAISTIYADAGRHYCDRTCQTSNKAALQHYMGMYVCTIVNSLQNL